MKITFTKSQLETYLEALKALHAKVSKLKNSPRRGFKLIEIEEEIKRITIITEEG